MSIGGKLEAEKEPAVAHEVEEEEEEEEFSLLSDSEIGDALDYLDSKDDGKAVNGAFSIHSRCPNAHGGIHSRPNASALQPLSNRMQSVLQHIRTSPLEEWEGRFNVGMSNSVTTEVRGSVRDMAIGKTKTTDKADRATVERAIDPRTRMILWKMYNRGEFSVINGCISTGKEANVYHATKSDGQELAIKLYITSVLVFKDRDRYVQGDYCFRHGYCRHNPRKMVPKWAEKEMRNLVRLKAAGIPYPKTHLLQDHVLVMDFIEVTVSNSGPLDCMARQVGLHLDLDANLSLDKLRECYRELVIIMRVLYKKCKLVHGDLSEYNILYYEGKLYIIDVSQSVDLDHPHALDFLREDSVHVSDFFRKHRVGVMTIRELFDFIVDPSIDDDSVDKYLEAVEQKILARGNEISAQDKIADSVFVQSYIPKTLDVVKNVEEDVIRLTSGKDTGDMYYKTITGLNQALSLSSEKEQNQHGRTLSEDPHVDPTGHFDSELEADTSDEEGEGNSSEEEYGGTLLDKAQMPADKKAVRKENKKKVKEEKRVARKTKVPKAAKKKKRKLAKAKKCR